MNYFLDKFILHSFLIYLRQSARVSYIFTCLFLVSYKPVSMKLRRFVTYSETFAIHGKKFSFLMLKQV